MTKALLLVALFAAYCSARVISSERCGFGDVDVCTNYNDDWVMVDRSHHSETHSLVIAVKRPSDAADNCGSLLDSVSDPSSASYGKYFTLEELSNLDLFSEKHSKKIEQWLEDHDLEYTKSYHGDWFTVTGTVGVLENLFDAEFYNFESFTAGKSIKRTPSYTIPKKLKDHVDFIGHTVTFPPVKQQIFAMAGDSGNTNPATLQQTYGLTNNYVNNPRSTQSLFEALGQNFSPADLQQFQQQENTQVQAVTKVIGPNDPSSCSSNPDACGEANLDVQYIMAVAQNATTWYWSMDQSLQDPFLSWVLALASTPNPPLVHSMSYGSIVTESQKNDMLRFNTEICQLGLRGLTVVVASGDDGVANFEARNNQSACGFNPSFPTTSPYVTGVGATQGPEVGQPEVACSSATNGLITTGGGFSIFFDRPAYQAAVVDNYLKNGPNVPPTNMFRSAGRAYPDVAMLGHNYEIVIGGNTYAVSGTSASAPVFAGFVTLVNNARLNAGKPPVGFLNPALYKLNGKAGIFNDITVGENNCCAGSPGQYICCQYGFTASKGWDPLTGFGSVNYGPFLSAMMNF